MSRPSFLHRLVHEPAWRPRWAVLWAGLMFFVAMAALSPGDAAPTLTPSDKLNHLLAFAALAAAGSLALRDRWHAALLVAGSMVAYGGFIELAQTQIPGRFADGADLLADGLGVALGLGTVHLLRRLWRDEIR